jgi:hypothetical protein
MKCFLHIGTEKTATTTIQAFFQANAKKLLDQGFIYTKSAGVGNNRALPVAAYDPQRRDAFTRRQKITSDKQFLEFQQGVVKNLKLEIDGLNKNADTIIFSSEHIQSRLTNPSELFRLKAILQALGATDITVIIYLRRPAEIANSLYSTAIKCGEQMWETPPPPDNPYFNNVCNHQQTLLKYAAVFSRSAIVPRLFDKAEFVNQSIIDDILSVIGIPESSDYNMPKNRNEGLSPLGIKLLRSLNKAIPTLLRNQPNPLRADLVAYVVRNFSNGRYVMPKSLYEAYDQAFQESNEWVRDEYFPERQHLFSTFVPEARVLDLPEKEMEELVAFIAEIWKHKQDDIIKLTKKLKHE